MRTVPDTQWEYKEWGGFKPMSPAISAPLNQALANRSNVVRVKIGSTEGDEYEHGLNSMTQARVRVADNRIVKKRKIRLIAIVKAGEAKEESWNSRACSGSW